MKNLRESNMELLRIIAMLSILVVHVVFPVFLNPERNEIVTSPINSFVQLYLVALTIIGVNAFVLLSGWYGIRFKYDKIAKLYFQVLFFSVLMFAIFARSDKTQGLLGTMADIFLINDYWFIRAYLILFVMAPVLNTFAEHVERNLFRNILIGYFVIQTLFSYLGNNIWWYDGYSPLTFWGIYLLGRYMRMYPNRLTMMNKTYDGLAYLFLSLVIALLSVLFILFANTGGHLYNYTCPLVIASSVFFFLFFTKIRFKSKTVNWIASSCVAVYLTHMSSWFFDTYFVGIIKNWINTEALPVWLSYTALYLLLIYVVSVLIDKVQILVFDGMASIIHKRTDS